MNPRYSEAFLAIVLGWSIGFVIFGPGGMLAGAILGAIVGSWRIKTGP